MSLLVFLFVHLAALFALGHAICYKRDPRSAYVWVLLIVFFPLLGTLFYFWIGINRVRVRARELKRKPPILGLPFAKISGQEEADSIFSISGRVNKARLVAGNSLQLLVNGEEAYPPMLRAIQEARETISLVTYIFDNDTVGRDFAKALVEAGRRGVVVRVLVDAVGARYSFPFPSIFRHLHGPNLQVRRFLDTLLPWSFHYSQLRNHRKCLIVDGRFSFTGGMNIREGHLASKADGDRTQDLHFRVEGPIVRELQAVFAEDWEFVSGERLEGKGWFPPDLVSTGSALMRVVSDGPDEDVEKLRWTLLAALGEARKSIRLLTPYFVPDNVLIAMLGLASLRGVRVEILLPEENNVFLVHWASRALLWQVLEKGCFVYASPRPFDHSKLFLIDDEWAMVGSANWDARSLRLNFELNLEIQDEFFLPVLVRAFERKRSKARAVTLEEMDSRHIGVRLRDGTARLLAPYL